MGPSGRAASGAMNGRTVPSRQARSSPSRMPAQGGSPPRRPPDSRSRCRQVAGVQAWNVSLAVQLAADPVVLVLDPDRWPQPLQDLGGVLGRRGEHELERMEQRQLGALEAALASEIRCCPDVAGEHARALTASSGRSNAFASAASTRPSRSPMRSSPDRTRTIPRAVFGSARASSVASRSALRAGPDAASIAANVAATSTRPGDPASSGASGIREHVAHRGADVREPVVRRREVAPIGARDLADGVRDGRPADAGRALVRLGEGPASEEHDRDRELVRVEGPQVLGEERGLLRRPGRGGDALGELAPAPHAGDGIPCLDGRRRGFPSGSRGISSCLEARSGERRRVPAVVLRPRGRPARALPGRPHALGRSTASSSSGRSATSR